MAGISQSDAEKIVNHTMRLIADSISEDGRFEFAGFGVWKKVRRKETDRPNPQNRSQRVITPARNTVTFRPAPALTATHRRATIDQTLNDQRPKPRRFQAF